MKLFKKRMLPNPESSQDKLPIRAIDDGFVVTKDDYLVQILKVGALNTELMSENELHDLYEENEAFLKAINDEIQIKIVSEPVNLTGYIDSQKKLREKSENPFQKDLLTSYIDYMKGMDVSRQTFRRQRYIIIQEKIQGYTENEYRKASETLKSKTQGIVSGLDKMKLSCETLSETEIIRYFHILFNYEHALHEQIYPERLQNMTVGKRKTKEEKR